jgi:cytochrome c
MHIQRRLFAGLAIAALVSTPAFAEERGTREEARAMNDAAFEHIKKVGAEKAYKDFTTDKASWTKKDLYVMVYNNSGVVLAHGANEKMVGKDMSGLKDGSGKPLIAALLETAAKGGGWFDYDWADPLTKKIAAKSTFARRQPNGEGFIGVGIYR